MLARLATLGWIGWLICAGGAVLLAVLAFASAGRLPVHHPTEMPRCRRSCDRAGTGADSLR